MSVICLLWLTAFITAIFSAAGKVPLWVPVVLITVVGLLACAPIIHG